MLKSEERLVVGRGSAFRTTAERLTFEMFDHNLNSEYGADTPEYQLMHRSEPFTWIHQDDLPETFELDGANQTLKVSAGINFARFTHLLSKTGFTVPHHWQVFDNGCGEYHPYRTQMAYSGMFGSIGDALATNIPQALEAQHGSWRDWVLGATIMLPEGSVVKSGSSVVKSVTGFDLHKLMIGARHTLGIFLDLTLKVIPTGSLQPHCFREDEAYQHKTWTFPYHETRSCSVKVEHGQFHSALKILGNRVWAHDTVSHTIWYEGHPQDARALGRHVWAQFWDDEPEVQSLQTQALMRRTKQLFDPTNKLNPGEFGFL